MSKSLQEKLSSYLLTNQIISKDTLDKAVEKGKRRRSSLSEVLVLDHLISEKELASAMSDILKIPMVNVSKAEIDEDALDVIPLAVARKYTVLPLSKDNNRLKLAMADPLNIYALDDIKVITKCEVEPMLALKTEIEEAIERVYSQDAADMADIIQEAEDKDEGLEIVGENNVDISTLTEESKKAPIVKMVELMLAEAIKKRSSDIHIEPTQKDLRIRYRIDGKLYEAFRLPKRNQNAVLARIKIMSRLDITESRAPQDGRFKIKLGSKEIDFRVSVLPVTYGGKVVLRALDKSNLSIGLEKLGFLKESLELFQKGLSRPYGMILLTGPTGSGKSTTLYSILNELNTPEKNIVTIEDPVEYQVNGITQMQVNPDIGLTFATGLRSILRQSPDVIMVGEIRDFETADIAIKASLTGEIVLSTLHTNDASGAITRLIDMGVEPFLIASSVILAAAQRLCRRICSHCKEKAEIPDSVFERLGLDRSHLKKKGLSEFYRGKGCPKCNNTGYYGRMGTLEILLVDDKVREMVIERLPSDRIKDYLVSAGMKTLRDNVLQKFYRGDTTLEEVLRLTTES